MARPAILPNSTPAPSPPGYSDQSFFLSSCAQYGCRAQFPSGRREANLPIEHFADQSHQRFRGVRLAQEIGHTHTGGLGDAVGDIAVSYTHL